MGSSDSLGDFLAFKCPIPTCTKSFAVRSNAKRHLRTHGIFPTSEHGSTSPSQFTVGFDTPLVSEVHEAGKLPSKLRWVPPSLSSRTNVDYLRGDAASDSEDEDADADADADAVSVPQIMVIAPDGTNTHIIDPTIDELPDSSVNARADAQTRSDEDHLSLLMRKAKFSE